MDYGENKGELQLTYEEIHKCVEDMYWNIRASGWQPDVIVAIACGGWLPARLFKNYFGVDAYSLGESYYDENNERKEEPRITQELKGLEAALEGKSILVVDEVDNTRATTLLGIDNIKHGFSPSEIRLAVLYQKQKEKTGDFPEDVVVYVGGSVPDIWIDFPWEAKDIDLHYSLVPAKLHYGK